MSPAPAAAPTRRCPHVVVQPEEPFERARSLRELGGAVQLGADEEPLVREHPDGGAVVDVGADAGVAEIAVPSPDLDADLGGVEKIVGDGPRELEARQDSWLTVTGVRVGIARRHEHLRADRAGDALAVPTKEADVAADADVADGDLVRRGPMRPAVQRRRAPVGEHLEGHEETEPHPIGQDEAHAGVQEELIPYDARDDGVVRAVVNQRPVRVVSYDADGDPPVAPQIERVQREPSAASLGGVVRTDGVAWDVLRARGRAHREDAGQGRGG